VNAPSRSKPKTRGGRDTVNGKSVMTVSEVAEYLRVHRTTIYRLLWKKKIPAFRVGSDWRFNRESIDEWKRTLEQPAE
jgi:excisionase family DNA binding protein